MPELLSPVGNINCLKAAINGGCDAVYLAGINFGARSFAGNFTNDEIIYAINLCHLYGVKVYVTVNTLIYDVEVERFLNYIDFLHRNNVDAIIMQDIGMIDLVRKTYPNLEIHASTQMHIHNLEGVKFCEKLGIKRVVLARETPIQLVNEIKNNTNTEIEIFVHGAICMSYSGQCLMSALIGNRSGNRGTCAQTCRQPYDLIIDGKVVNKEKYLLSSKDLNTLSHIDEIIKSNVDSIKIEGRMKSPQYVYMVTSLYRRALDNYKKYKTSKITEEDINDLKRIFNRDFTKGFLFNEDNDKFVNEFRPNNMGVPLGKVLSYKNGMVKIKLNSNLNLNDGIRIIGDYDTGTCVTSIFKNDKRVKTALKDDIVKIKLKGNIKPNDLVVKTTDYEFLNHIDKLIGIDKKIKINGKFIFKRNNKVQIYISDNKNEINIESDFIIEKAIKNPTTEKNISDQLNKLGDTIYVFDNLDIICDDDIFIPVSKINDLRRKFVNILNKKRLYEIKYVKKKYKIDLPNYDKKKYTNILVHTYNEYILNKDKFDYIYIDNIDEYKKIDDKKCILKLSRVNEHLKEINSKLLVGELGSLYKYEDVDTDFSLNVLNSYSVAFLHSIGVNKITLSYELNYKQIKGLILNYEKRYKKHPNLEVIINAREEAMICKYNLLKKYGVTKAKLKDKFNNEFPIEVKDGIMYIYNYKKRNLKEDYFHIGVNNIRINL